jgi:hypothetical protein
MKHTSSSRPAQWKVKRIVASATQGMLGGRPEPISPGRGAAWDLREAGLTEPVGTGPVRPVSGGTGPVSTPNSAYKLEFLVNRPVSPVNRAGFFFAKTGRFTV